MVSIESLALLPHRYVPLLPCPSRDRLSSLPLSKSPAGLGLTVLCHLFPVKTPCILFLVVFKETHGFPVRLVGFAFPPRLGPVPSVPFCYVSLINRRGSSYRSVTGFLGCGSWSLSKSSPLARFRDCGACTGSVCGLRLCFRAVPFWIAMPVGCGYFLQQRGK